MSIFETGAYSPHGEGACGTEILWVNGSLEMQEFLHGRYWSKFGSSQCAVLGLPKKQLFWIYTPSRAFSHCIGYDDLPQIKSGLLLNSLDLRNWVEYFDYLMHFYYMKIVKKCTKIHVFGKIAFLGWKNAFYLKTKFVPKTWSYCKTDEIAQI